MFFKAGQKGENQWHLYLVGALIIAIAYFLGQLPLGLDIMLFRGGVPENGTDAAEIAKLYPNKNYFLFLLMLTFVFAALATWFVIKFIHKKRVIDVITGFGNFRWNRFWFAFFIAFLLIAATSFGGYLFAPEEITLQFQPKKFIVLAILGIIFFPIQSGWEELFFRGYLMQGIGNLAKSRWVALLVTTLVFAAVHLANPEVVEHGVAAMFPLYAGMGLLFGIMVLMDNGLELAMGFHIANNLAIALFITSPESALQTDSVFRSNEVTDPSNSALQLLVFGAILAVFAWKYKWTNWNERLAGKIETPVKEETLA